MSNGDALSSAYLKLDWASQSQNKMQATFEEFLRASEGGTPYGIEVRELSRPPGAVCTKFILEREMPEEISLLAGDLVHNTRVALDHTIARLKERYGGNPGQGHFPICTTQKHWQQRVVARGRKSPLQGLEESPAFALVYEEQPLHRDDAANDPLVVLNSLDNADKHRLLHRAFAYPDARKGADLAEVVDKRRGLRTVTNHWEAGQPLSHGTRLATYIFSRGPSQSSGSPLSVRRDQPVGFAIGELDAGRVHFMDMIQRVRAIVDGAAALLTD